MQYTSNFNFNLPEGTDLWNYLTQTNPNFTALDSILKGIQDGTVTTATEVTSGTAHAVTRTLPDANVIRFTATGAWTLGDTMTIDGTPVTVVKPNGTSLQTGDYIIGSEVLGVLRATQFTVYLGAPSSLDAADVSYDNTGSGLTATDVQDAIDEVNSNLSQVMTWTLLGSAACNVGVSLDNLPASASELQIVVARGTLVQSESNEMYLKSIPTVLIPSFNRNFYETIWVNGNPYTGLRVVSYTYSTNLIKAIVYTANNDVSSTSGLWVYYK